MSRPTRFAMKIPPSSKRFRRLMPGATGVLVTAAGFMAQSACAQFYDELDTSGWFFRAGGVARFNVKASITGIAPAALPAYTDPSGHRYDDGYVLKDIGDSSSQTWNWGYQSSSQLAGDQLTFTRLENVPVTRSDFDVSDPLLGGEVFVGYRFSEFRIGKIPARIGIEVGYGYSEFSSDISIGASGTASYIKDTYDLHGVVPPVAPYAGTFNGPGPLLDREPSPANHFMASSAASTALHGALETSLHDFRAGPFFEVDLSRRLSVALGAGYSSVYTDSSFAYDQTVGFANSAFPQIAPTRAVLSAGTWHTGLYADMRMTYRFSPMVGLYLGADIKSNNEHKFGDSGHVLEIDLGSTYGVRAGINFQF